MGTHFNLNKFFPSDLSKKLSVVGTESFLNGDWTFSNALSVDVVRLNRQGNSTMLLLLFFCMKFRQQLDFFCRVDTVLKQLVQGLKRTLYCLSLLNFSTSIHWAWTNHSPEKNQSPFGIHSVQKTIWKCLEKPEGNFFQH